MDQKRLSAKVRSILEDTIISKDSDIANYKSVGLKVIW